MKKALLIKFFAFAVLATTFVACNRYEEGSNFSLISAKSRVANNWTMTTSTYELDGNSTTNTGFSDMTITFEKDGAYDMAYKLLGFPLTEVGTWVFNSDKTGIILSETDGDSETWTLIKLKNKELKASKAYNNGTLTFEFTGE